MVAADTKPPARVNQKPVRVLCGLIISTTLLLSIPILLDLLDATAILPPLYHPTPPTNTVLVPAPAPTTEPLKWATAELPPNFTDSLLSRWLEPRGSPCRDSLTSSIAIPSFTSPVRLRTGAAHEFLVQAVDELGNPRCLGGDYFETNLSGERWKSRPPLRDHGNGSYTLILQVHGEFAGTYNFTVALLFRRYDGLKFSTQKLAYDREVWRMEVEFYVHGEVKLPELRMCEGGDFKRDVWVGRWTRHKWNDSCEIDGEGRYRCLGEGVRCDKPWCYGPLGHLESNGWVYSTHCSFKIFKQSEAWKCLRNRWLFFWGDSNHVDTIRNLLKFVLGLTQVKSVPRRFDLNFTNPADHSQSVRITSIFNGHWNETLNYEGLNSLSDPVFRSILLRYFSEPRIPDFMILNSGLHDGIKWRSIRAFINAADHAVSFFTDVFRKWEQEGKGRPALFYRTTIATGGYARKLAFNPSKMEAFNGVMVEKMKALTAGVIDEFDMTFPWHFDNRCNDGVHYGRAPARAKWTDGGIGHQYFVDLMLGHVLLNAICNAK